jgi:hypothetical protein
MGEIWRVSNKAQFSVNIRTGWLQIFSTLKIGSGIIVLDRDVGSELSWWDSWLSA